MELSRIWDSRADEWVRWAQAPNLDGFWEGTLPALRTILPPPSGLAVDVGCGEGRFTRELLGLGYDVVGIDFSARLLAASAHVTPRIRAVGADAVALPFRDQSASLVTSCMCLQDLDDLGAALLEIDRILARGGYCCIALVHPWANVIGDGIPNSAASASPVRRYLVTQRMDAYAEHDGIGMHFTSVHRPLSAYLAALRSANLVLEELREEGAGPLPWLLTLRARATAH